MATEEKKSRALNPLFTEDHLANERTYMAWMRTAIAITSYGVVILKLRSSRGDSVFHYGFGWKLGLIFAIIGLLTVLFCTLQYFSVRKSIEEERFYPSELKILLFSGIVFFLGGAVIYFVLVSSYII
jgi:putative membrane protein